MAQTRVKMVVPLGTSDIKNLKGVVFDKDGTLFDFHAVWSVWCDRVVDELSGGDNAIANKLAQAIGYDREQRAFAASALIVSGAADDTAIAMAALLPEYNFESVNEVCNRQSVGLPLAPVKDLTTTIASLKSAGLTLGVATNDSEASAHAQLADSDISASFDFVCGYDSGFGAKPQAGMLEAFCHATGLLPSEIAMVGDSLHDINAGIAAGVGLTVGVLTGPATESDLAGHADVVMADISDLAELLL